MAAEWCPFGCTEHGRGWREIHPSAVARRRMLQLPRLATLIATILDAQSGATCLISEQEQQDLGGDAVQVGEAIGWRGRWFARAERPPTWWHFHFECAGASMLAARKSYALAAVCPRCGSGKNSPGGDGYERAGMSMPDVSTCAPQGVRRHEGRRGRPLDVLVEWEGADSDGDLWEESWVSVTYLSKDLRDEARELENELFGTRGAQAPSRRAAQRDEARQRQERERALMQWSSRLRDRARGALA